MKTEGHLMVSFTDNGEIYRVYTTLTHT